MSKFVVTFAGPVGSSKTPIAHHLSYTFNLPIFNNDTIRTEVAEDLLQFDNEEFRKRARKRIKNIVDRDLPFIYDASVDRTWEEIKQILINNIIGIQEINIIINNLLQNNQYKERLLNDTKKSHIELFKSLDHIIYSNTDIIHNVNNILHKSIKL